MPRVAPLPAALANPVRVAGLAAEVIVGRPGRIFVVVEGHALEGLVTVQLEHSFT